jgi:serine protease Do
MPMPVPGSVAEELRKRTVQVQVGSGRARSGGSGVVIGHERVITNAHVADEELALVEAWDGGVVEARCLKLDRRRDLALLAAPGLKAEAATWGDSDRLRAGTAVFAVGNPLGFVGAVSSGVVHGVGPLVGGLAWVQADLRLAPGSSGGPLADFHGQVVGINAMVVSGGLALAIPSQSVQSFLRRAKAGWSLGVVVRPVEMKSGKLGILVLEVSDGGAAAGASLLPGDILTGGNERVFRSMDDLQLAMDGAADGVLRLDFRRGGEQRLRQVVVRLRPEQVPNAA